MTAPGLLEMSGISLVLYEVQVSDVIPADTSHIYLAGVFSPEVFSPLEIRDLIPAAPSIALTAIS